MAELLLQKISKLGAAIDFVAASVDGDFFKSVPGSFIFFKNANASLTRTVGIIALNTPLSTPEAGSIDVPNLSVICPALGFRLFAVPPAYQSSGGQVNLVYSNIADLTIAVCYVGQ